VAKNIIAGVERQNGRGKLPFSNFGKEILNIERRTPNVEVKTRSSDPVPSCLPDSFIYSIFAIIIATHF
jgi:hypothetical protein